jgi:hypothetical protein
MKIFAAILIFFTIFFCTYIILTQVTFSDDRSDREISPPPAADPEQTNENYMIREEEDPFYYEPDIFLRKLSRRKLPPLSEKEKIIWSFRLAEANPFL